MNIKITTLKICIVTLLLSFGASFTKAQLSEDTLKFTLDAAKTYALTNNKDIEAARLELEIAKRKVKETVTIGLPQVNMDANYQHIFSVPEFGLPTTGYTQNAFTFSNGTTPDGFSQREVPELGNINQYMYEGEAFPIMEQDNITFDFTVSQLIFSGEYIVGLQASKVYKTISEQGLKQNQLDVMRNVENTFYMILVFKQNLKIVQENKTLTKQTLDEMTAMFEAGFMEDTEVDQIKLNLSRLNNLEVALKGQVKNSLNLLKYQLGIDFSQSIEVTNTIEELIKTIKYTYTEGFDINKNIEYQMVSNQVEISKLNLKRERTTFLPSIAAFFSHQERWKDPAFDLQPKDIAGVSLSLPLFTSGQRLYKVKQKAIDFDKTQIQKTQLQSGLQLQYQNLLLDYETSYNSYINQKESSEISKVIFEKTTIKVKEGVSSSLDLTQVQIQYLTSVQEYYNSILKLLNTKTEIDRLLSNSI